MCCADAGDPAPRGSRHRGMGNAAPRDRVRSVLFRGGARVEEQSGESPPTPPHFASQPSCRHYALSRVIGGERPPVCAPRRERPLLRRTPSDSTRSPSAVPITEPPGPSGKPESRADGRRSVTPLHVLRQENARDRPSRLGAQPAITSRPPRHDEQEPPETRVVGRLEDVVAAARSDQVRREARSIRDVTCKSGWTWWSG